MAHDRHRACADLVTQVHFRIPSAAFSSIQRSAMYKTELRVHVPSLDEWHAFGLEMVVTVRTDWRAAVREGVLACDGGPPSVDGSVPRPSNALFLSSMRVFVMGYLAQRLVEFKAARTAVEQRAVAQRRDVVFGVSAEDLLTLRPDLRVPFPVGSTGRATGSWSLFFVFVVVAV